MIVFDAKREAGNARARPAPAIASSPPRALNVVITSPFVWPWVRRGSERMLHDLSRYLLARGHRVTVYASGPEESVSDRDGVEYHVLRQKYTFAMRQFNSNHHFALRLQDALEASDPDVVFCMNYFDAYAAVTARRRRGARYKVVFHSAGILSKRYFRAVPLDRWMFSHVSREADLAIAVSRYAGEIYRRDFGAEPRVIAPPVMSSHFQAHAPLAAGSAPRVLFMGDLNERRKGARVLCRALARIRARFPNAELVFAGRVSEENRRAMVAAAAPAGSPPPVFLGVGTLEELPALYASASVTVLPAVREAFGMVLIESLAAGTPVVGCGDGGMTDIVSGPLVGRLFDPGPSPDEATNLDGLAESIIQVLEARKTPDVVAACRARAQEFCWEVLGSRYEQLLEEVVGPARAPRAEPAVGTTLVTVVIPTHGRRELLARLLASLERQTLDPALFEVIVVHNYTPDGTEEMARDWCARQPFKASYHRKAYDGPTRSRDFGARHGSGRYLAFIDDDCVAGPDWLKTGLRAFEQAEQGGGDRREVGVVQGRTMPMPGAHPRFLVRTVRVEQQSIYFETCNIFYSRRVFEDVGGFSEDFLNQFSGEDTDLGWKTVESGYRVVFAPEALVHHEVFRVTYMQWLREPLLLFKNLPYIAKKYPRMRRHMYRRYFFSRDTCLFNLLLAGVLAGFYSPWIGVALAAPYFVQRYRSGGHVGGVMNRLARVCFGVPRSILTWWALARGSIRARSLLL